MFEEDFFLIEILVTYIKNDERKHNHQINTITQKYYNTQKICVVYRLRHKKKQSNNFNWQSNNQIKRQKIKSSIKDLIKIWSVTQIYFGVFFMCLTFYIRF